MPDILTHNLKIYGWVRMLSARIYLPLIGIYLLDQAHLSFAQLAVLATVGGVVSLLANIPSGYIADRRSRKSALATGAGLIALSTLAYVLMPNFAGALIAITLDSLGYAFLSGAGEALMHDTLAHLGRTAEYVKVMGRAQSFALVGNVVLVGLVPLTYSIDPRLPFLCGTVAATAFIGIALRLVEPPRPAHAPLTGPRAASRLRHVHGLAQALRQWVNRYSLLLFATLGFMNAVYVVFALYSTPAMQRLGLDPSLTGIMFASSSVVAAVVARRLQVFKRFTLWQYAMLDAIIGSGYLIIIGVVQNLPLAIGWFIVNMAFWRFRSIIYQDHILSRYGNHAHKATLISTIGFFNDVFRITLPAAYVAAIGFGGLFTGLAIMGAAQIVAIFIFWTLALWVWHRPAALARTAPA